MFVVIISVMHCRLETGEKTEHADRRKSFAKNASLSLSKALEGLPPPPPHYPRRPPTLPDGEGRRSGLCARSVRGALFDASHFRR